MSEDSPDKTLSVGELIEALKQFPHDEAVYIETNIGGGPVLSPQVSEGGDGVPEGAVCLGYLWLAPDEYYDKHWIDHRGRKHVVKSYSVND
jgi:hypothetical protein